MQPPICLYPSDVNSSKKQKRKNFGENLDKRILIIFNDNNSIFSRTFLPRNTQNTRK